MRVAELDFRMTTSGNLTRDLTEAERRLQQIDQRANQVDTQLRGIGLGNGIRQDTQRAEAQLGQLGNAGRDAGQELARGIERGAQDAADSMGQIADAANDAGAEGGQGGGGSFMAGFTDKIKGLGGKGGPIAMALVGVAGIGLVAGGALMNAIMDGMQKEANKDAMQAAMGITEEQMGTIARASADAYTNVFGDSIASNMDAARKAFEAGLLTRGEGDPTQQEIQKVIEGLQTVATITGEDIPQVTRAAAQLYKTGFASNAEEAFDIIVKGQQKGLNASEDWLDTIIEYSTQWRQLGLTAEEAMALQSQMVQKGARDTDIASDALKEFAIRARDGSETSAEAFQAMGMDAEEMTTRFATGGDTAKQALREVLIAMQDLEDPVKKNAVAVGLFGTQSEDLGLALNNLNLDQAVQEFGTTAGTIANATKVMGDNAATSLEGAKRNIEVSMDGVKVALAQAFGPTLQQVANWINTHKPEIIGFFIAVSDAALATAQGIASFVSGSLRYFSFMATASGEFFGKFLDQFGMLSSAIGSVVKHIPGMEDTGNALEGVGNAMQEYDSTMIGVGSTLSQWADKVDAGNEALGRTRDSLAESGASAVATAEMFRALGDQVVSVPDDKTIIVTDNSPEAQQRFADLGIRIEQIPGSKDFKLVANTAEGQTRIDEFIRTNTGKEIPVSVAAYLDPATMARVEAGIRDPALRNSSPAYSPESGYVHYAQGTSDHSREPGIANRPILWGEAGPEAYIPLGADKRKRSTALLADVARRFGLDLVKMANGGIIDANALAAGTRGIEGATYVFGGWGDGWNTDCSGAQSRVANMIAYGNPDEGGRFATGNQGPALRARGFRDGPAPAGVPAYESGWINDPSMPGGGHTAGTFQFADGTRVNVEMGGARGDGQFGGEARGAAGFPNIMHYPLTTAYEGSSNSSAGGRNGAGGAPGAGYVPNVSVSLPDVMKVEVMNWPPAIADPNGSGARARLGVALYNSGGTVAGVGNTDTVPALLTPGEEVTRKAMADKYRGLLKAIARDDVAGYALGGTVGFGGFTTPQPNNYLSLRHLLYAGVGAGLTLASGWNDQGQFQGFSTGSTSIPGLDAALQKLSEIAAKPTVVIEHAEIRANEPKELAEKITNPLQTAISTMRV